MEYKFMLKDTKKPIKIGDFITKKSTNRFKNGYSVSEITFAVTEENINKLIKKGIIEKVEDTNTNKKAASTDIKYYICKVGKKLGYNEEESIKFFDNLKRINKGAAIKLLSKEIAIELDKKYPDHISDLEFAYIIDMSYYNIYKAYKEHIPDYNMAALFRTKEDAVLAISIIKQL